MALITIPWWMKLEWRNIKIIYALCVIEFPLTVAALALYGIASPNTYRTALWKEGARFGWNSDPIEILYSYANYKPIAAPVPWNQFTTDWNVVVSVLCMFCLLCKVVALITHVLPPCFAVVLSLMEAALYAVAVYQLAGPDFSDPSAPSRVPWYLTRSCGAPVDPKLAGDCMQAKASFAVAVIMCALFLTYAIVSLIQAVPSPRQRLSFSPRFSDVESPTSSDGGSGDKKFEMEMDRLRAVGGLRGHNPRSPGPGGLLSVPPMTPRTLAFNTLDGRRSNNKPGAGVGVQVRSVGVSGGGNTNRDLPFRHHISMGQDTYQGPGVAR